MGFLYAQDRNFEKEIQQTEKQIQNLQASIDKNNKEINKLKSEEKSTSQQLSITKKSIQNSKSLIDAYNRKINLYSLQLNNLRAAVEKNNKKILSIKNSYKSRSINIYKKKDSNLNNFILSANIHKIIWASLNEGKAEDVCIINLSGKSTIAEEMIIATGRSKRHIISISDHLSERLKGVGLSLIGIEGRAQGDWILLDVGDVIVHLFRQEVRDFYELEKMWSAILPEEVAT